MAKYKFKKALWLQDGDYVNAMKVLSSKKILFRSTPTGLKFDGFTALVVFVAYTAVIIALSYL